MTAELIQRLFLPGFANDVLRRWRTRPPSTWATASRRRGRLHHRLVRGEAALLSRRRHRPAGRARHGERPGRRRRPATVPRAPPSSSKRACRWPTCARIVASMRRRLPRGRRHPGHRRHQGRGPRQGRRHLHHHLRHRAGARGPRAVDPRARPGDRVLVSGTLGDHGIAIMSVREGLEFETVLESDSAALNGLAEAILKACPYTRCMRDPTRGGLSSAVNELAAASRRRRGARRGGHPAAPRGSRRLRDAGARPAVRRQRGQADRRRAAGRCRPRAGSDASSPAGQECGARRRGRRRPPRHGHHAVARGRRAAW